MKTTEEQRAYNAQKQKEYRAKEQLERAKTNEHCPYCSAFILSEYHLKFPCKSWAILGNPLGGDGTPNAV